MPTRLQQARYDGLLRRVGDLKGPGSKVSDVLGEVFPVLNLENLPAELYALAGWKLGVASANLVPTVGEVNITQLFNPAASGHLVVITRIIVTLGVNGIVEYDLVTGPLADTVSSSIPRDTRRGTRDAMVAEVRQVTQPGSLTPIGQFRVIGDTAFDFSDLDGLFVLGPGTGLSIGPAAVNIDILINFHWRERLAEPSELNF